MLTYFKTSLAAS